MSDSNYQHPLTIEIPVPFDEPKRHGIYSTITKDSVIIYCRLNKFDNELIERVSKQLELKPATFFRFCAVRTAQKLDELQHAYLQSLKPR